MRMLVLGGTAWLGRQLAQVAMDRGHNVTCLARGESGPVPDGARLVQADRSAPGAYAGVADEPWDAVVDVSWQPGLVRSALAALGEHAAHWTYVSSCSVYASHSTPRLNESAPLLPALAADTATREEYGEAKVACEEACREAVGDRLLVARAGLIGGYGDPSDRFGYWPARFAAASAAVGAWAGSDAVLVPDADSQPTQTVDVADLASWLVRCTETRVRGTFNAVGETRTLGEVLRASRAAAAVPRPGAAAQSPPPVVAVDSDWLTEQGVGAYMGPESLPLWLADPSYAGFSDRDGSAARAAGLRHRPLESLVQDALEWERHLGLDRERQAGLSPKREQELLSRWFARRGH